jgi:hypothetical protein
LDTHFYAEDAPHSLSYWATDQFTRLKQDCGMENWSVQLQLFNDDLQNDDEETALTEIPFSDTQKTNDHEAYKVDKYGRPVVTFDPEICRKPGEFAARVLTRLNTIRLLGLEPDEELSARDRARQILAGMAFGGQGFALLPIADKLAEFLPQTSGKPSLSISEIENHLIFNSCLNLACLSRSPEHVIASYGCIMSQATRKKIKPAFEQLEEFTPEIKILKMRLTEMRRQAHVISMQSFKKTA